MPGRKTTSRRSSRGRAARLFSPSSPKKALLVFVIIFALGGGGYLVVRTFAGSVLYKNAEQMAITNGALYPDSTVPGKISTKKAVLGGESGYARAYFTVYPLANTSFRSCALVHRGYYSPWGEMQITVRTPEPDPPDPYTNAIGKTFYPAGDQWVKLCTDSLFVPFTGYSRTIYVDVYNKASDLLDLAYVTLEW